MSSLQRHALPRIAVNTSFNTSLNSDDVQKVIHTYTLDIADTNLLFNVTIEPLAGLANQYRFFLSLKSEAVERPLSKPVDVILSVHPRELKFAVFMFPPKSSLPIGCLWSLRVWLRHSQIDHRLFAEDRLWIGRDPDFYAIEEARFAQFYNGSPTLKLYKVALGRTTIDLIAKWKIVGDSVYMLSLQYEHGGVGRILFENMSMRLSCLPEDINFVIYLLPISSTPQGASHRIRVWLRSPITSMHGSHDSVLSIRSFVCQRIWGSDEFKVGSALDFTALGPRTVMGAPTGGVYTITSPSQGSLYPDADNPDPFEYYEFTNNNREAI